MLLCYSKRRRKLHGAYKKGGLGPGTFRSNLENPHGTQTSNLGQKESAPGPSALKVNEAVELPNKCPTLAWGMNLGMSLKRATRDVHKTSEVHRGHSLCFLVLRFRMHGVPCWKAPSGGRSQGTGSWPAATRCTSRPKRLEQESASPLKPNRQFIFHTRTNRVGITEIQKGMQTPS